MSVRSGQIAIARSLPSETPPKSQPRQPILYWPVVVAAGALAVMFVLLCLAGAWVMTGGISLIPSPGLAEGQQRSTFPDPNATSSGGADLAAREGTGPAEASRPAAVAQAAAAKQLTEAAAMIQPQSAGPRSATFGVPQLALDAAPGDSVGKKQRAPAPEGQVADPGLVRIGDAVKAEGDNFGTQVEFASNPGDAAQQALKERKLMFVLHISGNFEDARFT